MIAPWILGLACAVSAAFGFALAASLAVAMGRFITRHPHLRRMAMQVLIARDQRATLEAVAREKYDA